MVCSMRNVLSDNGFPEITSKFQFSQTCMNKTINIIYQTKTKKTNHNVTTVFQKPKEKASTKHANHVSRNTPQNQCVSLAKQDNKYKRPSKAMCVSKNFPGKEKTSPKQLMTIKQKSNQCQEQTNKRNQPTKR